MIHLFKRLFGTTAKKAEPDTTASDSSKTSGLSLAHLEQLLKPMILPATRLQLQVSTPSPEDGSFTSHFGGRPYFEKGEAWPQAKNGRHLQFIFQVFNEPGLELPAPIQLIQFYYDFEGEPWQTESDGWLVKIYETVDHEHQEIVAFPGTLEELPYCEITFLKVQSLPSWEGIDGYSKEASDLACVLNAKEPWQVYDHAIEKLIGKQDYQSQLAGYPMWLQGDETPKNSSGEDMKLLFQIDSVEEAGLIWGDAGLIYVFYDTASQQLEFVLQCH